MADSGEDGDSDRFESADESLSEKESENETVINRDVSNDSKSVGYRKRPERIRPCPTRSRSFESTSKKNNDDFVKPEAILHDLTTNISKNINKSLGSIQQTSSSIKDMVFRSLPTSTLDSENDKLDLFEGDVFLSGSSHADVENAANRFPTEPDSSDDKHTEERDEIKEDETRIEETNINAESEIGGDLPFQESEENSGIEQEEDFGKTEGWDDFDFDESELAVEVERKAVIEDRTDRPNETCKDDNAETGSWGLPKWGVGTFLDTATAVTRGISNVLETGLGVPDPETLARAQKSEERENARKEEEEEEEETDKEEEERDGRNPFPTFGITSLVAGVTSKIVERSKVQEIGSRVISGGLDTLENIGKKTMQVLQEGDPGLKKKRALLLGNDKPVLSQMLREAKERAEKEDKMLQEKKAQRNCRFETLFDDFQGLVHLEALEMLSRQCELKLDQLRISTSDEERQDLQGILQEVKELCDIEESDYEMDPSTPVRFKTILTEAVEPLKNEISTRRIIEIHEQSEEWFKRKGSETGNRKIIYQKAMSTMAELTAATAHQFHKAGELLMVKERRKTVEEAEALMQLTKLLCLEVGFLSEKFLKVLNQVGDSEDAETRSENIARESENAISYIKQAFNLLIPVVQLGAT